MLRKVKDIRNMSFLYLGLGIVIFLLIFPLIYAIGGSLKSTEEFLLGGMKVFPTEWRWGNYLKAWNQANFARYTWNSIAFAVASVIGIVITTSMTGYTMSRCDFPGKKLLTGTFGFMMFLIGAVTLFPIFQLCKTLGLLDSIWGMVITQIATAQPFYCILVIGYCNGISKEIDEAATIDGAGFFRTYSTILMPIMKPILATTGILAFRDAWNNYMMPLAFTLSRSELRPLTVGVVLLKDQGDGVAAWSTMLAGTVMSIAPILIVYLILNRFFIEGITAGAIKG